jgi:hypothetical protein
MRSKVYAAVVLTSFAWNLYLVLGVMLGASYALDRAAGGQFEFFPTSIRAIYVLNFALVFYQMVIFINYLRGQVVKPKWILKVFIILGILGILANVASRSPLERWNVIPAAIITLAFYMSYLKQKKAS